jgi:hypothetical protein
VAAKRAAVMVYLNTKENLKRAANSVLADDSEIYWIIYEKRVFPGGIKEAREAARQAKAPK